MLSLAIFVGFKRFARSAGFALRCVAYTQWCAVYGHVCEPVCQCAGVRIVDYMLHRAANTRSPHASAQQPRFVCPQPRLAVVRECVCLCLCVRACVYLCVCVRAYIYGLWE